MTPIFWAATSLGQNSQEHFQALYLSKYQASDLDFFFQNVILLFLPVWQIFAIHWFCTIILFCLRSIMLHSLLKNRQFCHVKHIGTKVAAFSPPDIGLSIYVLNQVHIHSILVLSRYPSINTHPVKRIIPHWIIALFFHVNSSLMLQFYAQLNTMVLTSK